MAKAKTAKKAQKTAKASAKKAAPKKTAPKKAAAKKTAAKKTAPKSAGPAAKLKAKKAAKAPAKKATSKAGSKGVAKSAASNTSRAASAKATSAARTTKPSARIDAIFTPLDDRVLIERTGAVDRTPGGLYIPESVSTSDRPNSGKVLAVGRGRRDKKGRVRPLDVQLGDSVMYSTYGGSDVRINDQDYVLLREDEILAIVKP